MKTKILFFLTILSLLGCSKDDNIKTDPIFNYHLKPKLVLTLLELQYEEKYMYRVTEQELAADCLEKELFFGDPLIIYLGTKLK